MSPNTRGASPSSNDILIRGDAAARATPIDLVNGVLPGQLEAATGPWADELEEAREAARQKGFEQGHSEGLTAGMAKGEDQIAADMEAQIGALRSALETAIAGVEQQVSRTRDELAAQTTELALEIAGAVLGKELRTTEDPGADAIARCLALAPADGALTVRLNPDDAAVLGPVPGIGERTMTIVSDPELERGDAIVMADEATIDARLSESMRRVGEALL